MEGGEGEGARGGGCEDGGEERECGGGDESDDGETEEAEPAVKTQQLMYIIYEKDAEQST